MNERRLKLPNGRGRGRGMKKRVANEMNRRKWTSGEVGMGMMGQKAIGGRGKRTWG
jgi:hypothetical protein